MITSELLEESMDRALEYLSQRFIERGYWQDFPSHRFGTGLDWITGYVGHAITPSAKIKELLSNACELLISRNRNGAWGYNDQYFTDADSTSFCVLLLAEQQRLTPSISNRAREFLLAHHRPDGGFCTFNDEAALKADGRIQLESFAGWCSSHNSVTAIAIRALRSLGSHPQDETLQSAIGFLRERQDEQGLWSDYWWRGPYYPTYHATASIHQDPTRRSQAELLRIGRAVCDRQASSGYWSCRAPDEPCSFSTAHALSTLLFTQEQDFLRPAAAGVEWLLNAQRDDGAWTSPPILLIPRPNEIVPDPRKVNEESEAEFVFTTSSVFAALHTINHRLFGPYR